MPETKPPDRGRPPRAARGSESAPAPAASPHERFLGLDRARAHREWERYAGTPQRDLFRQIRERFLVRHAVAGGWTLDVGAGPGRFTPLVGAPGSRPVALDLSREMLRAGSELGGRAAPGRLTIDAVQGDALHLPFGPGMFSEVAVLGNALGFEADRGERLLSAAERATAPGGTLVVEIAPGPGERSVYLSRLPAGAVRRLLAAPLAAVVPRVRREGFVREPVRHRPAAFRRWSVSEMTDRWKRAGWNLLETIAVAPALGAAPEKLAAIADEPTAWGRLIQLEEEIGRWPSRWTDAAAVLLSVERGSSDQSI